MLTVRRGTCHDRTVGIFLVPTDLYQPPSRPFDPGATDWTFPASGPLSRANGALPWIIFRRDCRSFEDRFPRLACVSGTFAATFGAWRRLESWFDSSSEHWAMFALIHVTRV